MPAELSFSLKQARRLALAAQGFSGRQPPASIKAAQVNRLVERLGVLQIDSVNAVVRSHYLPLFSRLGNYSPLILEQAAWSSGRRRSLFEYWGHEASLLPMALYPLMRWRMERAARGQGIYQQMARFGREQQATIARVLGIVEQQGALGAGSLSTREERAGPWWDWSDEKHALEWLFAAGQVIHRQLLSGRANRVLILVPENLQHQWLVEMRRRFNLQVALFDEERFIESDAANPFEDTQLGAGGPGGPWRQRRVGGSRAKLGGRLCPARPGG